MTSGLRCHSRKSIFFAAACASALAASCRVPQPSNELATSAPASDAAAESSALPVASADYAGPVQSLIPADRLAKIKAALPRVTYGKLAAILASGETLWYDHEVMAPSYQDSLGANNNNDWQTLVAIGRERTDGIYDHGQKRWDFPFATTAGTDRATNLKVVNFVHIPHENGQPLSIPVWTARRNLGRALWMWTYPINTMFGEILFLTEGQELLPSEIRTRVRQTSGWATNVYRPFPTAQSLASAVKQHRQDWRQRESLVRLVEHLENPATLTPKSLVAAGDFRGTFSQQGTLDVLPDFGDAELVKTLLKSTPFVSTYGIEWKRNGDRATFAAAAGASGLSIVPRNYEAGLIAVDDDSCARCHKETGRNVDEFIDSLTAYGELWGKDGIFSFHPYDQSLYSRLRLNGFDNRRINPALSRMGVFESYNASKHTGSKYPARKTPRRGEGN